MDPNLFAGAQLNSVSGGMTSADTIDALQKALTAGYGTDVATLTGGGALRIQSLDTTLQATIAQQDNFVLFKKLPKPKAGATVDEWTEQSGVGGFPGGTTNTETGIVQDFTGAYARRTGQVKYLMTRRQVSFVTTLQNSMASAEQVEYQAGAIQLLSDLEYLLFEGNSSVDPTQFDGFSYLLRSGVAGGTVDPGNIVDVRGGPLTSIVPINSAAAQIAGLGNYGRPTDLFCSYKVQADFDSALDPAFRVPLTNVGDGGLKLGAPVVGIRTSHGNIANCPDVFVRDQDQGQPFDVLYPATGTAQAALKPTSITATHASNASSQFAAAQAGLYYYAVAGVNSQGQSNVTVSAQITVNAGDAVTLTITGTNAGETGYVLYRSRLNGGNTVAGSVVGQGSDFREFARIPASGTNTTTYVDYNQDIPGTTQAYVLNLAPGYNAAVWRQLLPMIKFPFYATNALVIPWAQAIFGYLRLSKRRQHVLIKNILPTAYFWRPFNV